MVCPRCIMAVESVFKKMDIAILSISLGEVEIEEQLTELELTELTQILDDLGFKLLDDKKKRIIEKIKTSIVELIYKPLVLKTNLSDFLSDRLRLDYTYISNLFSEEEDTTIEKYFISQKIERVKELLKYDELSLSEIAFQLSYSSVAHLSTQFKKVTGITPSQFKQTNSIKRKPIDEL